MHYIGICALHPCICALLPSLLFSFLYLHICLIKAAGIISTGTLVTLQPLFTVQIDCLVNTTLGIFGERSAPGPFSSYLFKPNNFSFLI